VYVRFRLHVFHWVCIGRRFWPDGLRTPTGRCLRRLVDWPAYCVDKTPFWLRIVVGSPAAADDAIPPAVTPRRSFLAARRSRGDSKSRTIPPPPPRTRPVGSARPDEFRPDVTRRSGVSSVANVLLFVFPCVDGVSEFASGEFHSSLI